ncbi:VOC family protein [Pseudoroseicyclus sp. CXY001]|uniref:VOC family protein n=1 Tax=Pseudoroseicyclus sp. CXY001 TaxID=3242492 RepID=UPI00358DA448
MPRIDAVAVFAHDLAATMRFYEALGFTFPAIDEATEHVEAEGPGPRLMIDSASLIERLIGEPPRAGNASAFALLCDSPAEVDSIAAALAAAGHPFVAAPFDAPWGQRYATVEDPSGHRIDLFAPL